MLARFKLAVLSLTLLGVAMNVDSARAQIPSVGLGTIVCQSTAVPPVVRAEGIAELVGDVIVTCSNVPGPLSSTVEGQLRNRITTNVSLSLNVNVTNNRDFGAGTSVTDAVLVVNENNCFVPSAVGSAGASPVPFAIAGCIGTDPRFQAPQFGTLAGAGNRLEWNQVDFPVPGSSASGVAVDCASSPVACFPFVTTVRITSVRGNASQLGVPDEASFPSTQIIAFLSITGPTTISVQNNQLNVAVPILGLIVGGPDGDRSVSGNQLLTGLQCVTQDAFDDPLTTWIQLTEGFATAFKTLGVPTFAAGQTQWESGYFAPGSGKNYSGGIEGGATQGTRFLLRFVNIPEGVELRVLNRVAHGIAVIGGGATQVVGSNVPVVPATSPPTVVPTLVLHRVAGTDSTGLGGNLVTAGAGASWFEVPLSGNTGYAVYEVVEDNPFAGENIWVPVQAGWEADTSNDRPEVGTGQVFVSFAPVSTNFTSDRDENGINEGEPRFVESQTARPLITIVRCTSTLLFPFVTNQAGFDTGIAIANSSKDWLGTDPQNGTCTIHYHGETTGGGAAPADQTSIVINGGEQLIFTLSGGNTDQGIAGAPDFQGYIIAVCEFQFGHGYAFITDGFGGIPNMAQGYLALILETEDGDRVGLGRDGSEILGH
jgi:hypothetical protein